jgi:polyribonucleotide nucleotidyltransferase
VPIIIGRGGSNIKRLIAESGAQVDLDRSSRRVTVRGRKAQVAKAVAMLDELVGEAGEEEEIPVPARQLGLIIGRGGATIRQLQADSGATIDVRKDVNSVKVRGSAAQVEKATGLIRELLSGAEAARTAAGPPPGLRPQPPPAAPPGLAAASPPGL